MEDLIQKLLDRLSVLEKTISRAEHDLKEAPKGKLRLSKTKNSMHYYQVSEEKRERVYIHLSEKELIRELAQKDYLELLLEKSRKEMMSIRSFLEEECFLKSNQVYSNLHEARKKLVKPILVDDDTYAEIWQSISYIPNPAFPEHLKYATKRGEMVRSKSEAMLADMYFDLGIPYKYDYPIKLIDGSVRYVDFVLLHKGTRKEIYHEHLGRLDMPDYLKDNMIKLDLYRRSGIFLGKNLILTHETEGSPLNMKVIRQNTRELFGI